MVFYGTVLMKRKLMIRILYSRIAFIAAPRILIVTAEFYMTLGMAYEYLEPQELEMNGCGYSYVER